MILDDEKDFIMPQQNSNYELIKTTSSSSGSHRLPPPVPPKTYRQNSNNSNSSSSTSNSNVTDSSTTSTTNTIPTSQPISQKVTEIPVEAAAVKAPPDHVKRNKKAKNQRMSESEARKILCKHKNL